MTDMQNDVIIIMDPTRNDDKDKSYGYHTDATMQDEFGKPHKCKSDMNRHQRQEVPGIEDKDMTDEPTDSPDHLVEEEPAEDCYLSLPSFNDYREICDMRHYRSLPGDWVVIVTDIADSTSYIESGRYRDVNTVGAMPIAAVRNAIGDTFPFVFGGDGASLVVRPEEKELAINALLAVQRLVAINYDMHLRVGCVNVSALEQKGATVKVARYEISTGTAIAMFSGRGLALAESIVKNGNELIQTDESRNCVPNLTGLSCRWNKVPNRNGCVLSLLVSTCPGCVTDNEELCIYRTVLEKLSQIMVLNESNNPVNMDLAHYRKAAELLKEEKRMHEYGRGSLAWFARAAEIRLCHCLFVWKILQKLIINVPVYTDNIRIHADHRKFDDMIRLVVDCSTEQVVLIKTFLEDLYRQGKICYGLHESEHCLLTCLVEDIQKGKHVHFVDGDKGGYTMAAKQWKSQLNQKQITNQTS